MTLPELLAALGVSGTAIAAGTRAAWKFLVVDRIKRAEDQADEWKRVWKSEVSAKRRVRMVAETAMGGPPSVAPPPDDDSEQEDQTEPARMMSEEDMAWLRRLERERVEREFQRYNNDMASTPPDPSVPRPRAKMPSRRG